MKKAEELKAEFLEAINASIAEHRAMLIQMVGTLYPGIIEDEIDRLRDLREKILSR